ncbi:MAG: ORF6N domain-containing protein [Candidatus Margulisbacteria bacterium]|nr:ORF6N domain-containing protein [Candidatus Margulisiibacteriota bacterium]
MGEIVPIARIEGKIYIIRGQKVMLDRDLAELYGVSTGRLNEQVKRNIERFPNDFKFSLTKEEILRISQFATSSTSDSKIKYSKNVNVFTEHGILMLASVLNSGRAIQVNIQIMRAFTKLRKIMFQNSDLKRKIEELENKYDHQFKVVFDAIKTLLNPVSPKKNQIGFLKEREK